MSIETKAQAPVAAKSDAEKIKELEAKLAATEKKLETAEEEILEKVMDMTGTTTEKLAELNRIKSDNEKMMEYNIGRQVVSINGRTYSGVGQAPRAVCEVIVSMAGNERQQRLKELTGNKHDVQMINGSVSSRVVGKVEESL